MSLEHCTLAHWLAKGVRVWFGSVLIDAHFYRQIEKLACFRFITLLTLL